MSTATTLLPDRFAELEPLARVWAIPDRNERYQIRLRSSMEELEAFYDAVMARAEEIIDYVDEFPMDDLPDEVQHLLWLLAALSIVSLAVEVYHQPKIPDSGSTYVAWVDGPVP